MNAILTCLSKYYKNKHVNLYSSNLKTFEQEKILDLKILYTCRQLILANDEIICATRYHKVKHYYKHFNVVLNFCKLYTIEDIDRLISGCVNANLIDDILYVMENADTLSELITFKCV